MGYVHAWIKLTIRVPDLEKSTRIRAVDEVIAPIVENEAVQGFEISKTEKVGFFRRGRYVE